MTAELAANDRYPDGPPTFHCRASIDGRRCDYRGERDDLLTHAAEERP